MSGKTAIVLGAGFSGLAAACCLAKDKFKVTVLEKNETPGGRARRMERDGYTFDMGPSWYWMPDVFDQFFQRFGRTAADYYQLQRLNPSYRVYFSKEMHWDIPATYPELRELFNKIEPGSAVKLDAFLKQAQAKYQTGVQNLVYKPGKSLMEYLTIDVLKGIWNFDLFQSFDQHIRKYFKDERLLQLLTFPILFLGASAKSTPALYSLMNYADIKLGTWYPQGGMHQIIQAMVRLAESLGVVIKYNHEVKNIKFNSSTATEVITSSSSFKMDLVVASADYQHVETKLLPRHLRSYSESYWESRKMAPSSLIYYVGVNKKLPELKHHNLFFDASLKIHSDEIYENPRWPQNPLFYVSVTSKTDPSVCPPGNENLFILIPVASDLQDSIEIQDRYFDLVVDRMELNLGTKIRDSISFRQSYSHQNFIHDYHAFKGNAYGLANTLRQTAILKPRLKSKRVKNLFFTGQLTVPGPGVPPSLISGQVVADEIIKQF